MDGSPKEKKQNIASLTDEPFSEGNKNQASNKTEKNPSFGEFIQQNPATFNFQLVFEEAHNLFLDVLFCYGFHLIKRNFL
jgi:hypothetical protein